MHLGLNRATSVYAIVFSVFALGIWAILDFGNAYLTAPRDVAGHWMPANGPPDQAVAFSIDQSGRYARFIFDERRAPVDTVLTPNSPQSGSASGQILRFDGDGWHVVATGNKASDDLKFSFQGPKGANVPAAGTYRREHISLPSAAQSQQSK